MHEKLVGAEPTAWMVKIYDNCGMLLDTRLEFVKPSIRSTARTEFVPLYAQPASAACDGTGRVEDQALLDVAAERRRHVEVEGWTPAHDDTHQNGEMAWAAAAYSIGLCALSGRIQVGKNFVPWLRAIWPWDLNWWKPTSRRRDLVKAGALIIAEIGRLDRAAALEGRADV